MFHDWVSMDMGVFFIWHHRTLWMPYNVNNLGLEINLWRKWCLVFYKFTHNYEKWSLFLKRKKKVWCFTVTIYWRTNYFVVSITLGFSDCLLRKWLPFCSCNNFGKFHYFPIMKLNTILKMLIVSLTNILWMFFDYFWRTCMTLFWT